MLKHNILKDVANVRQSECANLDLSDKDTDVITELLPHELVLSSYYPPSSSTSSFTDIESGAKFSTLRSIHVIEGDKRHRVRLEDASRKRIEVLV